MKRLRGRPWAGSARIVTVWAGERGVPRGGVRITADAELLIGVSLSDRIPANVTEKRLQHHAIDPEVAWIAELLDANRHRFMSSSGLGSIGTEEAVPPRQIESKIAVGFTHQDRMMDAMHVGRHHEPAQNAVDFSRDANVSVIEY